MYTLVHKTRTRSLNHNSHMHIPTQEEEEEGEGEGEEGEEEGDKENVVHGTRTCAIESNHATMEKQPSSWVRVFISCKVKIPTACVFLCFRNSFQASSVMNCRQ